MKLFKSVPFFRAYYLHLDQLSAVNNARYRFKDKSLVYAIRCKLTGQMYIGSTSASALRFWQHLIVHRDSNANLQAAIAKYGLSNFVLYILEEVKYPAKCTIQQRQALLLQREQAHMDYYPKTQLYNTIRSVAV